MRLDEKVAPVGALTAALISISCCLPFSIPAALGLAANLIVRAYPCMKRQAKASRGYAT